MSKKLDNFNGNAFAVVSDPVPGISDFDEYYEDYEIHDVPKKVGDGEYDYVMTKVKVVHKKSISEFINSQSSDVGIKAYVDRVGKGLINYEDVKVSDEVQDFSKMPNTLMEACALGDSIQEKAAKLPYDLIGDKSLEEFLSKVTKEDLIKYFAEKYKATGDDKGDK